MMYVQLVKHFIAKPESHADTLRLYTFLLERRVLMVRLPCPPLAIPMYQCVFILRRINIMNYFKKQ